MTELLVLLSALAVFLVVAGLGLPPRSLRRDVDLSASPYRQLRPRSIGGSKVMSGVASAGMRRAQADTDQNERFQRQLKQANWYWAPGEPLMPDARAPFWNLETLWSEKLFGAIVYGGLTAAVALALGVLLAINGRAPMWLFILIGGGLGIGVGSMAYSSPDEQLRGAAQRRQREISLEMGYRIPELRSDVLAGNTVQRAIRNMARRPGGPFVEELRRAVEVLDITKDDTVAMDQLIDRNEGNELVTEFANSLKLVSRQGGQISPVLDVLADVAQQRLRLQIQSQARRNLQEMTRPIGLSSLIITTLLVIVPAMVGLLASLSQ